MSHFTVGLTGGIGSGKTAAADKFASLGITIVDADLASRAVVAPGEPVLQQITEHFGTNILDEYGALNRRKLRHIVFAQAAQRLWLQSLLKPYVDAYLERHLKQATSAYVLLVNPLLIESRQQSWCDRLVVIDVCEELQIKRTMSRDDNSETQVQNIMRAQMTRLDRLARADDVIVNNQDLAHLDSQVEQLHNNYLARSNQKS
ncbi:MAG: dephospho-CoA kinase [Gammaproteobacteria bacterium]|nr:dephospho-CoA kinase [Gammaproteobacteria bacterium]